MDVGAADFGRSLPSLRGRVRRAAFLGELGCEGSCRLVPVPSAPLSSSCPARGPAEGARVLRCISADNGAAVHCLF